MSRIMIGISRNLVFYLFCFCGLTASVSNVQAEGAHRCYQNSMILDCFKAYATSLRPTHYRQLKGIVQRIEDSERWKQTYDHITITGHAAKFGTTTNFDLNARKRADNVAAALKDLLVEHGLDDKEIKIKSLGISSPKASNSTQKGRALNRRVEVILSVQSNVSGYVEALEEQCIRKGKRHELVRFDLSKHCTSPANAQASCKALLSLNSDEKFRGSACHPFELLCVVCKEG